MTDSIKDLIEPCPFCGGEANVSTRHYKDDENSVTTEYFISCINGDANNGGIGGYKTRNRAIKAWNTRTHSRQEKEIAVLRGQLGHAKVNFDFLLKAIRANDPQSELDLRCRDGICYIDQALQQADEVRDGQ